MGNREIHGKPGQVGASGHREIGKAKATVDEPQAGTGERG